MAVRSGNRYAPPLRAAPVTSQSRRWMAVGSANVLELDGAASPERSFVFTLDGAARVTRAALQGVDTQTRIQKSWWAAAELGVRVWQSGQLEVETAVRSVKPARREFDEALRVTGLLIVDSDLHQAIGGPLHLVAEVAPRIYAVLRHEDHLILT